VMVVSHHLSCACTPENRPKTKKDHIMVMSLRVDHPQTNQQAK
jgi:hypothetical protein